MTLESNPPAVQDAKPRPPLLVPVLIAAVVILLIVGLGVALVNSGRDSIDNGPAPDFALTSLDGAPFKLSQQRGKVVLVNFWASWCGPCRAEAPILNALYDDYKSKGVTFLGVGYLDNRGDALQFIRDYGMSYPTAPDDGSLVSSAYRVKAVPETYIIDKNGQIAYHLPAPFSMDNVKSVRALLDKLLAS